MLGRAGLRRVLLVVCAPPGRQHQMCGSDQDVGMANWNSLNSKLMPASRKHGVTSEIVA